MLLAEIPWQLFMTPFGIPIAAIICVFVWLSIASISEAVTRVICHRQDADLKLELLARGFSADEITRVVQAGRTSEEAQATDGRAYHRRPAGNAAV